ncbi:MAG: hypothetical protein ACHQ2Y_05380, partial [Candidatus Lutacidiplasmatales archaeon]
PPPPPPPSSGAGPSSNPRYAYLLQRLRGRQITMEEATELFAIQQALISAPTATATEPSPTDDAGAPPATGSPGRPGIPPAGALVAASADDLLWMSLLTMGAGAGVLAAVLKRAQEGPRNSGTK